MHADTISICIPVYNGSKFLRQCLTSCLEQSVRPLEIIVCDDCSDDNSAAIVQEYRQRFDIIKYYRNEKNLGLVGNWNRTLTLASGTWIKMLFQDDYLRSDCLEKFSAYTSQPVDLLVSRRQFVHEYQPDAAEKKHFAFKSKLFDALSHKRPALIKAGKLAALAAQNININFIAEPSLCLFRRQAAMDIGLFDPAFYQVCDVDFLLRLSAGRGLFYIPEDLCFFRLHHEATTNRNISTRSYLLGYLEPLLSAASILGHKQYKVLRSKLSGIHLQRIRLYLNVRLAEAKQAAGKTGNEKELKEYLERHPIIMENARPSPLDNLFLTLLKIRRKFF